jgi:hypothetical protein
MRGKNMKKLAWDYIVPVVLPKDLKGIEPGKLPANLLKSVPGGGKMHWIAAAAWTAMVEKAKAEGVELKPTSSGDTYRDYDLQKRGFLTRYQLEPIPGQSTKTFEGKTWYLKKGMAMLATPGKSQHNLGLAVDVHSASEPKRLNWLIANVKEFGFSWEVVPSEPWHLRYVSGDNVPPTVKAWMDANGVVAPVGKPPAAAPAAGGDDIKKLQEALKAKGFYKGEINGQKDAATNAAIKSFKVANKLGADFIVGPKVKQLLGIA